MPCHVALPLKWQNSNPATGLGGFGSAYKQIITGLGRWIKTHITVQMHQRDFLFFPSSSFYSSFERLPLHILVPLHAGLSMLVWCIPETSASSEHAFNPAGCMLEACQNRLNSVNVLPPNTRLKHCWRPRHNSSPLRWEEHIVPLCVRGREESVFNV